MFEKIVKVLRLYKDKFILGVIRPLVSKSVFFQHTPDFITQMNLIPEFHKKYHIFRKTGKRSIGDPNRYIQFRLLLDMVKNLPKGDYAELGTYRGVTAKIIYDQMNQNSELICFDTFEGFAESDVTKEKSETNLSVKVGHFSDTSLSFVSDFILGKNKIAQNLHLVKGLFPGTFEPYKNRSWRFVHLDCDLYEPMLAGIKEFWPNIQPGGILLIHDYNGTYRGVKKAVDEYFALQKERPIPLADKVGSIVVIKNKQI